MVLLCHTETRELIWGQPIISARQTCQFLTKNASKKRKQRSHEQEKQFMKSLKSVRATAVYPGDRKVTVEEARGEDDGSGDDLSDDNEETEFASMEQLTGTSTSDSDEELDSLTPLFFLYDCEGTGGSVYSDHIIEIAAVVQLLPGQIQIASQLHFQSLVYTAKRIAPVGYEKDDGWPIFSSFGPRMRVNKRCTFQETSFYEERLETVIQLYLTRKLNRNRNFHFNIPLEFLWNKMYLLKL